MHWNLDFAGWQIKCFPVDFTEAQRGKQTSRWCQVCSWWGNESRSTVSFFSSSMWSWEQVGAQNTLQLIAPWKTCLISLRLYHFKLYQVTCWKMHLLVFFKLVWHGVCSAAWLPDFTGCFTFPFMSESLKQRVWAERCHPALFRKGKIKLQQGKLKIFATP